MVCERVERGAVGVQHRGGKAGATKVPLFRRGCSRGRVGILDVVVLGELAVMAKSRLVFGSKGKKDERVDKEESAGPAGRWKRE